MTRNITLIALWAFVIATVQPVVAQETQHRPTTRRAGGTTSQQQPKDGDDAVKVTDQAIAELVAWKTTKAKTLLEGAEEAYGTTPEFKAATGLLLLSQEKIQQALDLLQAAAAASPNDPMPQFYTGEIFMIQKKYDAASTAWSKARTRAKTLVGKNPKDARAQYYLGAALVRLKKIENARTALGKAKINDFYSTMCTFQIGLSHVQPKEWQAAKDAFDGVLDSDPLFAPAYFYRGLTWSKLGRNDKMAEDLEQFIQLAPKSPDADTARAMLGAYAG